jgi:hypothetical protein
MGAECRWADRRELRSTPVSATREIHTTVVRVTSRIWRLPCVTGHHFSASERQMRDGSQVLSCDFRYRGFVIRLRSCSTHRLLLFCQATSSSAS